MDLLLGKQLKKKSPNGGASFGNRKVNFIVLHYTASDTAASAISWFMNPKSKVSAHFVIDKDGSITQLVGIDCMAWACGESKWKGVRDLNSRSISVELVNRGEEAYPQEQIDALIALCKKLFETMPTLKEIVGHEDISKGRKKDPGPLFPWFDLEVAGLSIRQLDRPAV